MDDNANQATVTPQELARLIVIGEAVKQAISQIMKVSVDDIAKLCISLDETKLKLLIGEEQLAKDRKRVATGQLAIQAALKFRQELQQFMDTGGTE